MHWTSHDAYGFEWQPMVRCPPRVSGRCGCAARARLAEQAARLHRHAALVDGSLVSPAPWRGLMRRQVMGCLVAGEEVRYARAYDRLVAAAAEPAWRLDEAALRVAHDACAGGGDLRDDALSVRYRNVLYGTHTFPAPERLKGLLDRALRLASGEPEPVIAAVRLHLNLLTIHPFPDGNGRTARLAGSMILAHSGLRSSLLIAIEESVSAAPGRYLATLDAYRLGLICDDACSLVLLELMLSRSTAVVAWIERRRWLVDTARRLGIDASETARAVADADHGARTDESAALAEAMRCAGVEPWDAFVRRMPLPSRASLCAQATRIAAEQAEARRERYRRTRRQGRGTGGGAWTVPAANSRSSSART
jgi:hypothetical protein